MSSYLSERTSSSTATTPVTVENNQVSPSKALSQKDLQENREPVGNMESQHRLLAERFDLDTFIPSFNFGAGFDFSDSEDNDESQNVQVAPSAEQLQEEYERQRKYCPTGSWYATNVYNNCIIIQSTSKSE